MSVADYIVVVAAGVLIAWSLAYLIPSTFQSWRLEQKDIYRRPAANRQKPSPIGSSRVRGKLNVVPPAADQSKGASVTLKADIPRRQFWQDGEQSQCWWCLAAVEPYEEPEQKFCAVCEKFAKENW